MKLNLINEKIFIAGAFGMVGSSILRKLCSMDKINKINILTPKREELDLSNYSDLEQWFKKNNPTVVILAAAKVGGINANSTKPYEFILENLKIQTNTIELAWKYGVKKLLFLGSSCIYPKLCPQPIKEEYLLNGELEKTNEFYAIAKIAGIKLCESLRIEHGFNTICLMPTNLYGRGDYYNTEYGHVLPSLIKKFYDAKKNNLKKVTCWGTGEALREFLFVDDLADACIYTLENWEPNQENYPKNKDGKALTWLNVGSPFEISIKSLASKISKYMRYEGEIIWDKSKPDGTPRKKLDNSKMTDLGWSAKTNLDEGIKLTIKYFENELQDNILRI